MASGDAIITPDTVYYRHTPLDYGTTAIRLVKVELLLSADGLIQCHIERRKLPESHEDGATGSTHYIPMGLEDLSHGHCQYTCLSYTWGDPKNQMNIRVNGRLFKVRKNLWDFLHIARGTLYDTFLWIDAISIDQENTQERNHQVQQMGKIYSGAETVLTWLGNDPKVERVLRSLNMATRQSKLYHDYDSQGWTTRTRAFKEWSAAHIVMDDDKPMLISKPAFSVILSDVVRSGPSDTSNILSDTTGKVEKLFQNLSDNEYWSRAWITQEVLLGKSTMVVAGAEAHSLLSLASIYRASILYFKESAFGTLMDLIYLQQQRKEALSAIRLHDVGTGLEEWSVIQLLHRFRNQKCAIHRDRIYSLLALSNEAKKLQVDYNVSEEHVMRQLLTLRESSMCLCSAAITAHALAPWKFPNDEGEGKPFAELHMYASSLTSAVCPCCSSWVPFSWTRKKGLLFCFRTACLDTLGHLFSEFPDITGGTCTSIAGAIYKQLRRNNKSQLLCNNKVGVSIVQSQWKHVYMLRFTLRVLIEILQDDTTSGNLGLNACGNLWPSDSNQRPSDDARLRLCDSA